MIPYSPLYSRCACRACITVASHQFWINEITQNLRKWETGLTAVCVLQSFKALIVCDEDDFLKVYKVLPYLLSFILSCTVSHFLVSFSYWISPIFFTLTQQWPGGKTFLALCKFNPAWRVLQNSYRFIRNGYTFLKLQWLILTSWMTSFPVPQAWNK